MKNILFFFAILSQAALAEWYNSFDDFCSTIKKMFKEEKIESGLPIKINSIGPKKIKDFQDVILPPWTIDYKNITEFYEKKEKLYRNVAIGNTNYSRALLHSPDSIDGTYYLEGPTPISDWLHCPPNTRCYLSAVYSKKDKTWMNYENFEPVVQNYTWSNLQPSYENNKLSLNYTFHGPHAAQLLINKIKYKITWKNPPGYKPFFTDGLTEEKNLYILDLDNVASMYSPHGFLGATETDVTFSE